MTNLPFEHRATKATTQDDGWRGRLRSLLLSLLRSLQSFNEWLDDSWLGAALGALIILAFMVAIPVLLPVAFEVLK